MHNWIIHNWIMQVLWLDRSAAREDTTGAGGGNGGIETTISGSAGPVDFRLKSDLGGITIKSLTNDVCEQLLTEAHVAATPGSALEPNSMDQDILCYQPGANTGCTGEDRAGARIIGMA